MKEGSLVRVKSKNFNHLRKRAVLDNKHVLGTVGGVHILRDMLFAGVLRVSEDRGKIVRLESGFLYPVAMLEEADL